MNVVTTKGHTKMLKEDRADFSDRVGSVEPSLVGRGAVLSWMFIFPLLLIFLLYRFRKLYNRHPTIYTISFLLVFVYLVFHAMVIFFMIYL